MDEVQVNVKNGRPTARFGYQVGVPDLFEQCALLGHWFGARRRPGLYARGQAKKSAKPKFCTGRSLEQVTGRDEQALPFVAGTFGEFIASLFYGNSPPRLSQSATR